MDKIKSCPFCGAEAKIDGYWESNIARNNYRIRCVGSEFHCLDRWDDTKEDAIAAWNQRPELKLST